MLINNQCTDNEEFVRQRIIPVLEERGDKAAADLILTAIHNFILSKDFMCEMQKYLIGSRYDDMLYDIYRMLNETTEHWADNGKDYFYLNNLLTFAKYCEFDKDKIHPKLRELVDILDKRNIWKIEYHITRSRDNLCKGMIYRSKDCCYKLKNDYFMCGKTIEINGEFNEF